MPSYQVLARKWRPRTFAEMAGQRHVLQALINALTQNRLHHAYLLTGTRGVGKTTIARILAKCLNCETGITATPCGQCTTCKEIDEGRFIDLIEVDAASRTKVEDTRELLENVQYAPSKGRFKVYLIDEVHMLSGHSFNALLKTLEEPPPHVKFVLATTDPQKLPETILSRCLQFHLKNLLPEQIEQQLQHILMKENIRYETAGLQQLACAANGSMRDALSLLDQAIAFGNGEIIAAQVNTMLGTIEDHYLFDLLTALIQKNARAIFTTIDRINEQGHDFVTALASFLSLLHQVAIIQSVPDYSILDPERLTTIRSLASQLSAEEVQLYYQIALIGSRDLPLAPTPRSGFEMVMLRMLAFSPTTPHTLKPTATTRNTPAAALSTPHSSVVAPVSPTVTAATQQPQNLDWTALLPKLGLTGSLYAFASHCSLAKLQENAVELIADPSQKALLNNKVQERLSQAFSRYFNRPMKVTLRTGAGNLPTPAALKEAAQRQKQAQAKTVIEQTANVQALMTAFDAKMVPNSVTVIDDEQ